MRTRRLLAVAALWGGLLAAGCTAKVEEEGKLPDVDVEDGKVTVDPGELPKVDVDPAKVEISTDTQRTESDTAVADTTP